MPEKLASIVENLIEVPFEIECVYTLTQLFAMPVIGFGIMYDSIFVNRPERKSSEKHLEIIAFL